MKIRSIRQIEPELSRCIEIDSEERLFAVGGENGQSVISHNSVAQRNIVNACIMRPDHWRFLGIDLKRVELSGFRPFSNVVLGIATTLEDALTVLRFAQTTMMRRYAELEQLGLNNFLDLPEKGTKALLVMVDEAGELLGSSGVKALAGSTIIPTPNGDKTLESLELGDDVYDVYGIPTRVINKYEPEAQDTYSLKISKVEPTKDKGVPDESVNSESFIAGAEHWWVAYFESPDGTVSGPEVVDTKRLYEFKLEQELFPEDERTLVKFKRCSQSS